MSFALQANSEFIEYLLNMIRVNGKISYKVKFQVYEKEGYLALYDFFDRIKEAQDEFVSKNLIYQDSTFDLLPIEEISWTFVCSEVDYFNKLHKKVTALGYSESILKTSDSINLRMNHIKTKGISEKISYLSVLPASKFWKF